MYVTGLIRSHSLFYSIGFTIFNQLQLQHLSMAKVQCIPWVKSEPAEPKTNTTHQGRNHTRYQLRGWEVNNSSDREELGDKNDV